MWRPDFYLCQQYWGIFFCWSLYWLLGPNCKSYDFSSNLQDLLGTSGLMSGSPLEQQGAVLSLCTLMTIAPSDTFLEFEKVKFIMLECDYRTHVLFLRADSLCITWQNFGSQVDRYTHDTLSPIDIQVKFDFLIVFQLCHKIWWCYMLIVMNLPLVGTNNDCRSTVGHLN